MNFEVEFERALKQADEGAGREGLKLLEAILAEAVARADSEWKHRVAMTAGVLAEEVGETRQALYYHLLALECDWNDACSHLTVGRVCEELGLASLAQERFARAREAAERNADKRVLDLLADRRYR